MHDETISTPKRILPTDYARQIAARAKDGNARLYTELHEFIDETRTMWGDKVSFSRWLGQCKDFTPHELRVIRDGMKDARGVRSMSALFFWKLVEERKRRRKAEAKQLSI